MKRALIAGFMSLVSSLWAVALMVLAAVHPVTEWNGGSRLWASISANGYTLPVILALAVFACSFCWMIVEFVKKD